MEINKFKYTILYKDNVLNSNSYGLYCNVYDFWKRTWKTIFENVGSPTAWNADDFLRQDLIPVITYEDQIVATHYYTLFDLRNPSVMDIRYFSIFSNEARKWVFENKFSSVMSMEFLSVSTDWRKKSLGFSFAEVLIALGFKLMLEQQQPAAVGVAVKVAGVDEMAKKLNCSLIDREVKRGNLVCDIMAQTQRGVKDHPDSRVQEIIESLWKNRIYSESNQLKKWAS